MPVTPNSTLTTYELTITTLEDDKPAGQETARGSAKKVAAWARAFADEIDPPRPLMRGDQ